MSVTFVTQGQSRIICTNRGGSSNVTVSVCLWLASQCIDKHSSIEHIPTALSITSIAITYNTDNTSQLQPNDNVSKSNLFSFRRISNYRSDYTEWCMYFNHVNKNTGTVNSVTRTHNVIPTANVQCTVFQFTQRSCVQGDPTSLIRFRSLRCSNGGCNYTVI